MTSQLMHQERKMIAATITAAHLGNWILKKLLGSKYGLFQEAMAPPNDRPPSPPPSPVRPVRRRHIRLTLTPMALSDSPELPAPPQEPPTPPHPPLPPGAIINPWDHGSSVDPPGYPFPHAGDAS
ncbi:uncharacterized protein LOC144619819 [Crassostrea virginica]